MDYTAYGEEIASGVGLRTNAQGFDSAINPRQQYGLTERDEATGLDHTWFRKNEGRAGRWTSPDPYNGSMSLGDPQSFNRNSYVQNDPVNFVDPSGLFRWIDPNPFGSSYHSDGCYSLYVDGVLVGSVGNCGSGGDVSGEVATGVVGGGTPNSPKPDCNELAAQIKEFLNSLQRRARQLMQNLGGLEGTPLDNHVNRFKEEQAGLRTRLHEWDTQGCGGPGPTPRIPENAWKWATDPPPPPGISPTANRSQLVRVATNVVVTIGVAYVLYRIVRMVPSLMPPLWWTIPANVAFP